MSYHHKNANLGVDGATLTRLRVKAGFSLQEVAEVCECNKSQVSRWEQGKLHPSEERIRKMAEMFGTAEFVVMKKLEG